MKDILNAIISWIEYRPYAKRALEYKARIELGITPSEFTRISLDLVKYEHPWKNPNYPKEMLYYHGPKTTERRIKEFFKMLAIKDGIFTSAILGPAGELYARSLLLKAGFKGVPKICNMGKFVDEIKPDLLFWTEIENIPMRVLVEVKNRRESYYPRKDMFTDLIEDAQQLGAQPILIIANLSEEGEIFCRENGIAVLHLKCQIVPAQYSVVIHSLERKGTVLHPGESLLVPKRVFQHEEQVLEETWRHLAVIQDRNWILGPNKVWRWKWMNRTI